MKKNYLFILLLLLSFNSNAQLLRDIEANENAKSGNYKDVLSSMFQLASKNLAGDNKTIEFNSTLFALKAKANPASTIRYGNYKQRFERNFQFNFKVKLDSVFKYDGFNGGITYAIVNQRDKHLADFANSELQVLFNELSDEIQNQLGGLGAYAMTDINSTVQKILNDEDPANYTATENAIKLILFSNLDVALYAAPKVLSGGVAVANTSGMVTALHALRLQYYTQMESKALWTVTADGAANTEGKFDQASFGTVFLLGNKEAWNEIDVRAKLTYADTLQTEHLPRTGFNAKAGMNFKIGKSPTQQSFFEIKIYGEYNSIFNNVMINEEKNSVFANADFRLRIADDLWIPLTVKYDTENANFLGFLNVTYNFGN